MNLGFNGASIVVLIIMFIFGSFGIYMCSCPTHNVGFTLDALHLRVLMSKASEVVSLSLAHM